MRSFKYLFIFLFISWGANSQTLNTTKYLLPIQPGKPNFLAGSMGELRPNHFHGGIDLKTGGKEGLPVFAAADGYISRINVSASGYGNVLYIMHPDGNTTVYAHLLEFSNEIAKYVREYQYKNKKFEVELTPQKDDFVIKRGQQIALSGNSGSSGGPHLHFEIRDKMQNPLNPLKFGFTEIKDDIPPIVQKIALKTMDKNSRINNMFGRFEFPVIRQGNDYVINSPIIVQGVIGAEILTHDKLTGASNRNGVPCIEFNIDGEKIFHQNLTTFSFNDSRNILVHSNYAIKKITGNEFQKLYIDDGNELKFYETNNLAGKIKITDDRAHKATIELWDAYNNKSKVSFLLKGATPQKTLTKPHFINPNNKIEIFDNTLLVYKNLSDKNQKEIKLYTSGKMQQILPDYEINNTGFYLIDMRTAIPDSIDTEVEMLRPGISVMASSEKEFIYNASNIELNIPSKALFDTTYLKLNHMIDKTGKRELFFIHEDLNPIRKNISIVLKPTFPITEKAKSHVYAVNKFGKYDYAGGTWVGNDIRFNTKNFGTFVIIHDTIAPVIKPLVKNRDVISFIITDALSGVKEFTATVNGEWLLMNYDKKRNLIWSEKPDGEFNFKGDFQLIVTDNAGNSSVHTTKLL